MPSLLVLFERTPSPPSIGELLREAGFEPQVEVRSGPVKGRGIVEAAALSTWPGANDAVGRHAAHVVLSAAPPTLEALLGLTRAAASVLELPGALALLDEEGRVLSDPAQVNERLLGATTTPPLDLWIAQRGFELADARGHFLDTVGMAQLGLPDLEAYAGDGSARAHTAAWLRNLALYLVQDQGGAPLRNGDTLDGPDERPWTTTEDRATVEPSRQVLRFTPL